jgi:glycine oxidase
MSPKGAYVAVVGAGIAGRLVALRLADAGTRVALYDKGDWTSRAAVSFTAAGMLSPLAEAAQGEREVMALGMDAPERWTQIVARLSEPVTLRRAGSLVAARAGDERELDDFAARIARRRPDARIERLGRAQLAALEPDLAESCAAALHLADEGQIDTTEAMTALGAALARHPLVEPRLGIQVDTVAPYVVIATSVASAAQASERFDAVVDCRGLGARFDAPDLRGVRGELLEVSAPDVHLARPVRLLHPRHPIYVVPRASGRFIVGATCIESESTGPVTVTSALELLTALYPLHPGFRLAGIERLATGLRPAYSDNLPHVDAAPGLVRVNGLFRHGFLLGPALAERAVEALRTEALT